METQGAIDTYAAMPRMPQKRRGLFGGKMDMEDFQMALARAAAYIQGDYEGAAAITGQMGKARQGRLDAAQLATMLAQDTSLTDQQRQMFAMAPDKYFEYATERMKPQKEPELPADVRTANWYQTATPEQRAAYTESRRGDPLVSTTLPGNRFYSGPASGLPGALGAFTGGQSAGVQEGQTATNPQTGQKIQYRNGQWVTMGGGASNGTGNFRP